jgi:hypothetical protein
MTVPEGAPVPTSQDGAAAVLLDAGCAAKCTIFCANIPYLEQIPEKQDKQVTHNQCFALIKANKERMDLVEIWCGRQGIGNREWDGPRLW